MIAARDPQEFIPSGRQQALRHPGPLGALYDQNAGTASDLLLNRFEQVSIHETVRSEWWIMRKSPQNLMTEEQKKNIDTNSLNKTYALHNSTKSQQSELFDNSWSWKSMDPKISKRISDINLSKRASDGESAKNDSKSNNPPEKSMRDCKKAMQMNKCAKQQVNVAFMEEELYVKDNVAIWTKSLVSSGNASQSIVCSYSSEAPIKHALWCTFYCERPAFDCANNEILKKPDEPLGSPMPSVCVIDSQYMQVFSVNEEDFFTPLPFQIAQVWTCKYGLILERDVKRYVNHKPEDASSTIFSLMHPLDEFCPVAVRQGSVRLIDDTTLKIVFTSDAPSICMLYDGHTGQHSVYQIRRVRNDEWIEMSDKFPSLAPSLLSLSSKLKSKLCMWDGEKGGLSQVAANPFSSRATSSTSFHGHSNQPSRSHSPMATISRCQSPAMSPLFASSPWLLKSSRYHSSSHNMNTNYSTQEHTNLDTTEDYRRPTPSLCFHHLWTDGFVSHQETTHVGPASKAFLVDDLVGQSYLCYLMPSRSQLSMVRVDFSTSNPVFGVLTSISAKDAVPISHLHMLAILEHNGNIVLYSGLTIVGKLHIGGVLVQHAPSPHMKHLPQFNSPFPRRSTLLPHFGTPISNPFKEHLLSPVLPITICNTKNPVNCANLGDAEKMCVTQLTGLRDAIEDRVTLQYVDGSFYRITLPALSSALLIETSLIALKQTLQKDAAMTLMTRWYAARNAPGPGDLSFHQEWQMFTALIFELLGYEEEQSNEHPMDPVTPANAAKRQRQFSLGTDLDWNLLLESDHHKMVHTNLSKQLNLRTTVAKSEATTKSMKRQINTKSVLFPYIRLIHYTMHLTYEELKLNTLRNENLRYLAGFLSRLACDLTLQDYVVHYWKDFPEHCLLSVVNEDLISQNDWKNIVQWPVMSSKAESVMEYLYDLLNKKELPAYPHVPGVNPRTKAVIQLCGIFLLGIQNPHKEIYYDTLIKTVLPPGTRTEPFSTPKGKSITFDQNVAQKVVLLMTEFNITTRTLDTYPAAINLLLHDALWRCRENPPVDWTAKAYNLLQRPDLAAQAQLAQKNKLDTPTNKYRAYATGPMVDFLPTIKQLDDTRYEDGMEDVDSTLLKLRFAADHRVMEARRLLKSSKPVPISLVQRPEISDHDFIEEQEKHLYAICARTMALPVGRGMFTLRTATPVITEPLPVPRLCLSGKAPPRGVTVELTHIDTPPNMNLWPQFHNGVANGLRISPDAHNIDSNWIVFNKPKFSSDNVMEHAGFLMALGLNGHLPNLAVLNTFDYLSKIQEMTSIGLLLGFASASRGTSDTNVTKLLGIHVEALLPPTSMELDIPQNLQVAALLGVGLVYQGTAHRRMTEVLLTEIGRPPGPEMENSIDRESYSLAAGLALGLVTLRQGGKPSGLSDLFVPDTLHYYMVGGNRRALTGSQRDKYRVPSFQIREGTSVNLDVTAPGATLALGLMYLGSGNSALADWMTPPDTQYMLDFIRPDFLMLRILAKALIMWNDVRSDRDWIENQIPETIRQFCMVKPSLENADVDYEAMNQVYCNIVAGACFAMGLKYAGSSNEEAFETLLYYCHMFTSLTCKSIAELAGKPTIETCLNVAILSASMVMAGTGNLEIMRIVRHLRRRVGLSSSAIVTYGSHLAVHMALGLLFLGGGRYTLSNSPASIAALICAFYPKFPTHSNDNRYHLQAFRHLYVLAVEHRLVIPKDVVTGRMCYAGLRVIRLDGSSLTAKGPCLIPDLNNLSKLAVEDERYWPVVFERGRNWDQLEKILGSCGFIEVKQRAGCLSYVEDKLGYRSLLSRTLSQSPIVPWNPPSTAIVSFSSDSTVRHFSDHFLTPPTIPNKSSIQETKLRNILTKATYDCVIRDKMAVLPNFISLVKVIEDLNSAPNALQIWQFKLTIAQVCDNSFSTNFILPETVLSLHQQAVTVITNWESDLQEALKSYIMGEGVICSANTLQHLATYVTFYDIPFGICRTLLGNEFNGSDCLKLLCSLGDKNYAAKTIDRILTIVDNFL